MAEPLQTRIYPGSGRVPDLPFPDNSPSRFPSSSTPPAENQPAKTFIPIRLYDSSNANDPANNKNNLYAFRMRFYDYKKPLASSTASFADSMAPLDYEIYLPLPLEIIDQVNINYTTEDLELLGDMAPFLTNFEQAATQGPEQLSQFMANAANNLGPTAANRLFYQIAPGFLNRITGIIPGFGNVTATVQQSFGATTNPNQALVMQGPQLRNWSFRWVLIPHSAEESINVQKLIRVLKARSLPYIAKSANNTDNKPTGLLGYPQICLLNFYPWDGASNSIASIFEWTDRSIVKIKRTMISNVTAVYNGQNTPAYFRDTQNPVTIELNVSFKEIEYFLSEDEAEPDYTPQTVRTPAINTENFIAKLFANTSANTQTSNTVGGF